MSFDTCWGEIVTPGPSPLDLSPGAGSPGSLGGQDFDQPLPQVLGVREGVQGAEGHPSRLVFPCLSGRSRLGRRTGHGPRAARADPRGEEGPGEEAEKGAEERGEEAASEGCSPERAGQALRGPAGPGLPPWVRRPSHAGPGRVRRVSGVPGGTGARVSCSKSGSWGQWCPRSPGPALVGVTTEPPPPVPARALGVPGRPWFTPFPRQAEPGICQQLCASLSRSSRKSQAPVRSLASVGRGTCGEVKSRVPAASPRPRRPQWFSSSGSGVQPVASAASTKTGFPGETQLGHTHLCVDRGERCMRSRPGRRRTPLTPTAAPAPGTHSPFPSDRPARLHPSPRPPSVSVGASIPDDCARGSHAQRGLLRSASFARRNV